MIDFEKTYIQNSALKRLKDNELLELLNTGNYIIQYGKFTPDIQIKIKELI